MIEESTSKEVSTQTIFEEWDPSTDFDCPIMHTMISDPVVAPDGHIYERSNIERWLQNSSISPITKKEFPATFELIPLFWFRDKVDKYQSQEAITKRSRRDREEEYKKAEVLRREGLPLLKLGISEEDLSKISLNKAQVLQKHFNAVKTLMEENRISWEDLIETDIRTLEKILHFSFRITLILKSGLFWNELIQTNLSVLEKIIRHSANLGILLKAGISWSDIIQNSEKLNELFERSVFVTQIVNSLKESGLSLNKLMRLPTDQLLVILPARLSTSSEANKFVKKIGLTWDQLVDLSDNKIKFLFDNTQNILSWLNKNPRPPLSFFLEHHDLLDGFIKNQEHIDQWLRNHPPYQLTNLFGTFLEIHQERCAEGQNIDFSDQLPTYFSCFLEKKYQIEEKRKAQERKNEELRQAQTAWQIIENGIKQELYKHLRGSAFSSPSEKLIDDYLMNFFPTNEKQTFKETIIFPLIKKDKELGLNDALVSFHNIKLLAITPYAENLSQILEILANVLKALFPYENIPKGYQWILSNRILTQFISHRKLGFLTEKSAFILFIRCYMDELLNKITRIGIQLHLDLATSAMLQVRKIQQELQIEWDALLSIDADYCPSISATRIERLDLQLSLMKKMIDEAIINSKIFRYDGHLQRFCLFLNVLLFIPLLPVFLMRLCLNFWDEEKCPNVLFIPDTTFIRLVRERQSKITDLQKRMTLHQSQLANMFMHYTHPSKSNNEPCEECKGKVMAS